jgi:hypothetical protein
VEVRKGLKGGSKHHLPRLIHPEKGNDGALTPPVPLGDFKLSRTRRLREPPYFPRLLEDALEPFQAHSLAFTR